MASGILLTFDYQWAHTLTRLSAYAECVDVPMFKSMPATSRALHQRDKQLSDRYSDWLDGWLVAVDVHNLGCSQCADCIRSTELYDVGVTLSSTRLVHHLPSNQSISQPVNQSINADIRW